MSALKPTASPSDMADATSDQYDPFASRGTIQRTLIVPILPEPVSSSRNLSVVGTMQVDRIQARSGAAHTILGPSSSLTPGSLSLSDFAASPVSL